MVCILFDLGILSLLNTLIEKMFQFFPNLVDKVASESGALFLGGRPVFIDNSNEGLAKSLFGTEKAGQDLASIEMG